MTELGKRMREESKIWYPPVERDSIARTLRRLRHWWERRWSRWFVVEENGEIIGFLFCYLSEQVFARARVAVEDLIYVVPERRGSMAAVRLIRRFEEWGRSRHAYCFALGVYTNLMLNRTGAFYERLGYRAVGVDFFKYAR